MASVFPGTILVIKARNGMHPDELQYPSPEFDGVMPLRCCVVVTSDDVNTIQWFRQS